MARLLAVAAIAWPLVMGLALRERLHGRESVWTTAVYLVGARVCHQRPERSFHSAGVQWPVCGRCSGLYLAAPFGALAALELARRHRNRTPRGMVALLLLSSLPTGVTLIGEWTGVMTPTNLVRALAALPLGACVAFVLVRTAGGSRESIG